MTDRSAKPDDRAQGGSRGAAPGRPADKGFRQQMLEEDLTLGEPGTVAQGGREGGELSRKVGTRDEKKRAFERPAPVSRVRKKDEREGG